MKTSRIVKSAIIESMSKNNQFRTDGFSLRKGFTGDYQIQGIQDYTTRKGVESFRMNCTAPNGMAQIAGYFVVNALLLPKEVELSKIEPVRSDRVGVYYHRNFKDAFGSMPRIHSLLMEGDFEFPDTIEVIGALVAKDSKEEHPYVPLSRYPFYNLLLSHHQTLTPGATFITRDEIEGYVNGKGKDRPVGLPTKYEFKLANHEESVWEMDKWSPTLLVRDWR